MANEQEPIRYDRYSKTVRAEYIIRQEDFINSEEPVQIYSKDSLNQYSDDQSQQIVTYNIERYPKECSLQQKYVVRNESEKVYDLEAFYNMIKKNWENPDLFPTEGVGTSKLKIKAIDNGKLTNDCTSRFLFNQWIPTMRALINFMKKIKGPDIFKSDMINYAIPELLNRIGKETDDSVEEYFMNYLLTDVNNLDFIRSIRNDNIERGDFLDRSERGSFRYSLTRNIAAGGQTVQNDKERVSFNLDYLTNHSGTYLKNNLDTLEGAAAINEGLLPKSDYEIKNSLYNTYLQSPGRIFYWFQPTENSKTVQPFWNIFRRLKKYKVTDYENGITDISEFFIYTSKNNQDYFVNTSVFNINGGIWKKWKEKSVEKIVDEQGRNFKEITGVLEPLRAIRWILKTLTANFNTFGHYTNSFIEILEEKGYNNYSHKYYPMYQMCCKIADNYIIQEGYYYQGKFYYDKNHKNLIGNSVYNGPKSNTSVIFKKENMIFINLGSSSRTLYRYGLPITKEEVEGTITIYRSQSRIEQETIFRPVTMWQFFGINRTNFRKHILWLLAFSHEQIYRRLLYPNSKLSLTPPNGEQNKPRWIFEQLKNNKDFNDDAAISSKNGVDQLQSLIRIPIEKEDDIIEYVDKIVFYNVDPRKFIGQPVRKITIEYSQPIEIYFNNDPNLCGYTEKSEDNLYRYEFSFPDNEIFDIKTVTLTQRQPVPSDTQQGRIIVERAMLDGLD